jgi:uncharacterized protein (TIGR03118 family)
LHSASALNKRKISIMKKSKFKITGGGFASSAVTTIKSGAALLMCVMAAWSSDAGNSSRFPALPPVCEKLSPPAGTDLHFHVYAVGVQIYRWDGTNWAFVAPQATLFADAGHHSQVGTHFGTATGPAWETVSGSRVVEQRVESCTPDATAIPWLLLRTLSHEGQGVLDEVTHVQRVKTAEGLSPSGAGAFVGEERQVPYTAEYFFYRGPERVRVDILASDLPNLGQLQDTNLVNAWGVTFAGAGPFWVANNVSGKATLYVVTNDASGNEFIAKQSLEVKIPGAGRPTGVISNNKGGFNGDVFLFAGLDGVISGWRSALGTNAEVLATRAGAIYTGLALTTNSAGPLLLVADFAEGTLDAYSTNGSLLARYADSTAPAGYVPFNVQVVNGIVFVMLAKHQDGEGRGLIDTFDPESGAFHRFATGTDAGGNLAQINSPWSIALAPGSFGRHGGDLLVGNFGSGTIMSFGFDGKFHGLLKDVNGGPIEIERLWGLTFGNGGRAGSPETLFFASGPQSESHGLFGTLKPADKSN